MVGLEEEIIDKDFTQSYWLALQFWVQPNRIFTGTPTEQEFVKPRFLSLQYDDVTVKIINTAGNIAGSTSVKMADRMSRMRVEKNQAKTRGNDVIKT